MKYSESLIKLIEMTGKNSAKYTFPNCSVNTVKDVPTSNILCKQMSCTQCSFSRHFVNHRYLDEIFKNIK